MKTVNKIQIALLLGVTLALGACSENFLQRDPSGSTLIHSQYVKVENALAGALRGVYSMMYEYGGHDVFGQRSIDMYGDLLSGDMALTSKTYGWFQDDEQMETRASRSGYLWTYYYSMLHNINAVVRAAKEGYSLLDSVAVYGLPNDGLYVVDAGGDTIHTYTEEDGVIANYYAQALTMRGYAYSGLIRFFSPTVAHIYGSEIGMNIDTYKVFPLYNEDNMDEAQPMASFSEVYKQIESDMETAISFFEAFEGTYVRANKLEPDVNIARGIYAYALLNKAYLSNTYDESMPLVKEPMTKALKYAVDVINSGDFQIIPNANLYSTGFNSVEDASWMWGEDVTIETATGLGSFFGQVDIHSYSYAWAGDTKVIDKQLYDSIPSWDGRSLWFNDGTKNASFKLCPDKKFFSAKSKNSTAADDIDREWLSDNVFMRIESIYLIAAEASYFLGKQDSAVAFLDAILSERLNPESLTAASDYNAFKATLNDRTAFMQELYRNWRLELWGEGYGLQTFRRLSYLYKGSSNPESDKVYRGSNHLYNPSKPIEYSDNIYTMVIPSSETTYNPHMQDED